MTIILPNMCKEFRDNPPFIACCKYCGAEARMGGTTWWEWWQYFCECSKHCADSKVIYGGGKSPQEVIDEWNKENEGNNER